jgi:hypothetical protein
VKPDHPEIERPVQFIILDVPFPGREQHTGMVEQKDDDRDQP